MYMHIRRAKGISPSLLPYSGLSLTVTRKGPTNSFEIERVRDGERNLERNQWKGTEKIVRDREKFELERINCSKFAINIV